MIMRRSWMFLVFLGFLSLLLAQQQGVRKPVQDQSAASFSYDAKKDEPTIRIQNVAYESINANLAGRPADELLVLRKTSRSKYIIGDIGFEATTTVEAWLLGTDLKQKPLYSVTQTGNECRTVDEALLVFNRRTEEVDWWSVFQSSTGKHLFDTVVPLLGFSTSRETLTQRYAGLEVPEDDAKDARLKEPHVVGVIAYASGQRVIREALLTSDDPKQAAELRSFADESWTMSYAAHSLKIVFTQNYPSPANPLTVTIPVTRDDLDLSRAQLPPHLHIAAWKR
jgi:hypothetical protein